MCKRVTVDIFWPVTHVEDTTDPVTLRFLGTGIWEAPSVRKGNGL